MNLGVGLAVLALVQLVLPLILDRILAPMGRPWFIRLMTDRGDDGLGLLPTPQGPRGGIKQVFTETTADLGSSRTDAVLKATELVSAARSVAASLAVALAGALVTLVLVAMSAATPSDEMVRLALLCASSIAAAWMLWQLIRSVRSQRLATNIHGESRYRGQPWSLNNSWALFWFRARSRDVLTRYITVTLLVSAVTIASAAGL